MARYRKPLDIHALTSEERQRLQPGQVVYAWEEDGAKGRFMGSNGRIDVVAWFGNAKGWRRMPGGIAAYNRALRDYAKGLTRA